MPSLRVDRDLLLHYVVDDYTDPWRQPQTIVLLHGLGESGAVWYGWVPHLAREYRVIRPDLRGFGDSTPMPAGYAWSVDTLVRDCAGSSSFRVETDAINAAPPVRMDWPVNA